MGYARPIPGGSVIYQELYDRLLNVCRQITSHRQSLAKPALEEAVLGHVGPDVPNDRLLAHLVAESLLKRIDRQLLESKNIYVQQFDIPQTTLFYSMAEAVPFVYAGHMLANHFLLQAAAGLDRLTVLDIGIGSGKQMLHLLRLLAESGGAVKEARVVGLDPVADNLEKSRRAFEELDAELPFAVSFVPVEGLFEELGDGGLEKISSARKGALLVNTAFSFHHTMHPLGDRQRRTELLGRIRSLQPLVLTMVEPSSDHDTEELPRRFHHCWQHFGNVFALVDEAAIEPSHKFLIKEKFFGREIRDIFGVSDHFRCERHEWYESWLLRLHRAGFSPARKATLSPELPGYCSSSSAEGLVRLEYNGIPIVAVMAFSP